jgi:hypothetical protein
MYGTSNKETLSLLTSEKVSRIANVIRAIEGMKDFGGVKIIDGEYVRNTDFEIKGGFPINKYGFDKDQRLVIIGSR